MLPQVPLGMLMYSTMLMRFGARPPKSYHASERAMVHTATTRWKSVGVSHGIMGKLSPSRRQREAMFNWKGCLGVAVRPCGRDGVLFVFGSELKGLCDLPAGGLMWRGAARTPLIQTGNLRL